MRKWILITLLGQSPYALAQKNEKLETIIDRLEQKLDDQRETIIEPYQIVKKNEKNLGHTSTEVTISTQPEETQTISKLEQETNKLEKELEALSDKVNQSAANIQISSKGSPTAKISYEFLNPEKYRTKNLRITLNDAVIYLYTIKNSLLDAPEKFVAYKGNLPQGTHKLQINGTWIATADKLVADQDYTWSSSAEFDIVAEGTGNEKKLKVSINPPSTEKKTGEIKILEGEN